MKKRFIILFISSSLIISLLLGCSGSSNDMLSNSLNNVSSIKIDYTDEKKSDTTIDDKELIKKIYDSVKTTKTNTKKNPKELEAQESDPVFTIEINYNDGKNDIIKTTETGKFIYKTLDKKGSWIGGENTELANIIGGNK